MAEILTPPATTSSLFARNNSGHLYVKVPTGVTVQWQHSTPVSQAEDVWIVIATRNEDFSLNVDQVPNQLQRIVSTPAGARAWFEEAV